MNWSTHSSGGRGLEYIFALSVVRKEPAHMVLGKICGPRAPQEEGKYSTTTTLLIY